MPPTETMLDAINTALDTNGEDTGAPNDDSQTAEEGAPADDTSLETGDNQNADGAASNDGEEGEPGSDEAEGAESEGEGDKTGLVRDPVTGKFVKKADVTEPKPGDKTADPKAVAKKEPDPVNDPIPKDLKVETQQRIRTLIDRTKEAETKVQKTQENFDFMIRGIQATNTTPEQYGELLSFMGLFNSGDPAQQEKALEVLEGVADRLATMLGKDRAVGDPLTQHADLKDAVAKGQITAQYAKELARQRNQAQFQTQIRTQAQQQTQQQQQQQAERDGARQALNELEESLKASDPQYEAKKAQILPILKTIFPSIPPSQWKAKFQEAYRAAVLPRAAPKLPAQQPMRAGRSAGGGGSGKTADGGMSGGGPKTMYDAINGALANMR